MKHALIALASLALFACSSGAATPSTTDDGSGAPIPPTTTSGGGAGATGTPGTPGSPGTPGAPGDDGGSPTATGDDGGGAPSDPDAGTPPSGGAGGVFANAPAYVATLGPSADNAKHAGNPNPAGTACLSCHGGQRPNIVRFLFAGTVWSDASGKTPTPQAEVRAVGTDGKGLSAYTDANGNFFYPAAGAALAPPAHGGARDATNVRLMNNVFSEGDCNSCHTTGGQGVIALP